MDDISQRAKKVIEALSIEKKKQTIATLESESANLDFWKDHEKAGETMRQLSKLQKEVKDAELLRVYIEAKDYSKAEELMQTLESTLYFSKPYDSSNAIMAIHAGQGGVEAMDWAMMLYRMYSRFCEKKGWEVEVIDQTPGEEAGIKSITFTVAGEYAYGNLKYEAGVHRLVRLSPFNADNLRQTSFAMTEVLPDIGEDKGITLKEDEMKWDFYRAGGHGGQNVNKVSSAVRLTHIPTGIVVSVQSERYQGKNREYALKILKAKLWTLKEEERKKKELSFKGGYKTPGWGNQIRSYVLHPYHMVKDLRTKTETSDTQGVLDGNIDPFIEEELRSL